MVFLPILDLLSSLCGQSNWKRLCGSYLATSVVLLSIDVLYDSFGVIAEDAKRVYMFGNLLVLNRLLVTVSFCDFIL